MKTSDAKSKLITLNFIPKNHQSWNDFLTPEIIADLATIYRQIKDKNINPDLDKVLRFLEFDFNNLKIIILGQDPYPEPGRATGLAFQLNNSPQWGQPFRQSSFKNIARLLYKNQFDIADYNQIPRFCDIRKSIKNKQFQILNPYQLIESWHKQGVLMLNSSLSCLHNQPQSHQLLWQDFTKKLITYIDQQKPQANWFLWGKSAQNYQAIIVNGKLYLSRHPMLCSIKYADDFLKSNCFKDNWHQINWLN